MSGAIHRERFSNLEISGTKDIGRGGIGFNLDEKTKIDVHG